eukprot:TRINITY_DN26206_c0_g1_i1.p1 TRINITY_DN26206_c0_g1~~TRINITY_DN26206_c0_g1_i1.p1  ORF type:complete len:275 (+),score=61.44 TRINITY_DN26206_c0_g1_i1:37-861(+)
MDMDFERGPRKDTYEEQKNLVVFYAYPEIKKLFIKRVYQILTIQLVITFGIILGLNYWVRCNYSVEAPEVTLIKEVAGTVKEGEENSPSTLIETPASRFKAENTTLVQFLLWTSLIGSFVVLTALHFCAKKFPLNLGMLGVFTICESIFLSLTLLETDLPLLLQAAEITTTVFIALTLYTIYSKEDYSWMLSYLITGIWVIIIGGFLQIFFPIPLYQAAVSWSGALLFSAFIIYDTWRLHKQLKVDEYITACISLYLDFLNLFIRVLAILSKKK